MSAYIALDVLRSRRCAKTVQQNEVRVAKFITIAYFRLTCEVAFQMIGILKTARETAHGTDRVK